MQVILSLDIGTSKIAAVAYACQTRESITVVSTTNLATLPGLSPAKHEQDPEAIYRTGLQLLRQLVDSGDFACDDVAAIAISGQMHGVMLAERDLTPATHLMTWIDQRSATLTTSLDRSNWPVERTGCYLHPGYGGATLAALSQQGQIPARVTALTIADFVAAQLCGKAATEPTHAASWGILDVRQNCWDAPTLTRLGIPPAILPEIRPSMSPLGQLHADLGLPAKVMILSPLGDNQASFIGTCGLDSDALLFNLGTGGQISLPSAEFTFRPELETRPLPFGGFLLVGASLCGGRSYAQLKEFFKQTLLEFTGTTPSDSKLFEVMGNLATHAATLPLEVDTRFAGTRMTPSVRGSITGISTENFTPASLCSGVIHGMITELTRMIPPAASASFKRVLASGNAVRKNPLALQLIAQELKCPCELSVNREEAATGAALAAARAMNLL